MSAFAIDSSYRKSFFLSLVLHLIVLSILIISFDFSQNPVQENNSPNPEMIHAVIMNIPQTPVPVAKPTMPKMMPMQPQPQIVPQQPMPKIIPVEKPRPTPDSDAIALNMLKKQQHDALQKQLLADLKKEKLEKITKQKKLKQQALEKALAAEMKNLSQKSLLSQLQNEKNQAIQTDMAKMHGIVDKYRALILQTVGHHWLIPANANKNATTKLLIMLEPGGMVTDVQIYQSSGNVALDNSARAAVFKASPLPVPTDRDEFQPFKQFVLVFKPMMFEKA